MGLKQFQDESATVSTTLMEPSVNKTGCDNAVEIDETSIATLLLGLLLRGRLSDGEQELLDSLAPHTSISFLINGESYVHPRNVRLFPMELVDATRMHGGDAVFTQRYRPQSIHAENEYLVYTGLINPGEAIPMVLGFFGPEYELSGPNVDVRFCRVMSAFRRGYQSVTDMVPRLRTRIESPNPCILVQQESGEIIAANDSAASLLGKDAAEMIGHDYLEARKRLNQAVEHSRIKLENLVAGGLSLSLLSLVPSDRADSLAGRAMAEQFFHSCRNKLTGITAATSLLAGMSGETLSDDDAELAETALRQAEELDHLLERFGLLLNGDQAPTRAQELGDSLRQAIELVNRQYPEAYSENTYLIVPHTTVEATPNSLVRLFESVLMSHYLVDTAHPGTKITCDTATDHERVRLAFETTITGGTSESRELRTHTEYAGRLTSLLGIPMKVDWPDDGRKMITTITINTAGQQ